MLHLISLAGLAAFLLLAWALSENRRAVPWRTVIWGLGLQAILGAILLTTGIRGPLFEGVRAAFTVLTNATNAGAAFVFGDLTRLILINKDAVSGEIAQGQFAPVSTDVTLGAAVAFQVLPVIIFVSGLSAVLYHLRIIQVAVYAIAAVMRRSMKTSGAETLGAALLIFVGIEAVSAIRGYLQGMTRSELFTIMVTFMATIAGSVIVIYASAFGAEPGHLLTASLLSAPAAIVIAKLMIPETGTPQTAGAAPVRLPVETRNVLDAAAVGTAQGLQMALNVGAMLIVFLGLVYLINLGTAALFGLRLEEIFGFLFRPFAFLMGVPWSESAAVGQLLGVKTVLNEFLGYQQYGAMMAGETPLSPRSAMIATYALCGFANPGSVGIMLAGLDTLIPERRGEVSALCGRAFVAGTLACFCTACIAGILADA